MSKFVKSGTTTAPPPSFEKVEIQASRRDQKRQEAISAPSQPKSTEGGRGGVPVPVWAGKPPLGTVLHVMKEGKLIDSIPLLAAMTVFGRGQAADVVLDHQSLSRLHAAVCYQRMTGRWMVQELGSVHGTTCNGKPVSKSQPMEVKEGSKIQFGASSRIFVLHGSKGGATAKPSSHPSANGTEETSRPSALEDLGGYGPQAATSPGRFADLVQESILDSGTFGRKAVKRPAEVSSSRRHAATQPLMTGLYASLPPPERSKS